MSISEAFQTFLDNLKVDNADTISLRYGEITAACNKRFRDTESKSSNNLQVGSYGRWTAIRGISDLDMLYIMPSGLWDDYKDGGQSDILSDTCKAIKDRYPRTTVFVDSPVVRALYNDFHIEVQPVFKLIDGSFRYPNTADGGSWKITKPQAEIDAMAEFNNEKNQNLRRLCKMVRAWKNKHGVAMGGLLIDTLAHNFLKQTSDYDTKSYLYYDWMSRDFFAYLKDLPDQDYYAALGSGQRVKVKQKFQRKAKKAHKLCLSAIEAEKEEYRNDRWRKVYGRQFPPRASVVVEKSASITVDAHTARNTEEFIEDKFPVDIRHSIELDCRVTQNGFRPTLLRLILGGPGFLQVNKKLEFFVTSYDVPRPFDLYWKVLNRGPTAVRRKCIRGQIEKDWGHMERNETTDFRGDHIVECYAVKDGVVVATDRIHVPITTTGD